MKKIVFALLLILCLCSCTKNQIELKLTEITFTAELSYFNEVYVFDGHIDKEGTLIAKIKEPEGLQDLKLTVNADGITADYKGLTYTANEATMPFSKIVSDFYGPIGFLCKNQSALEERDGEISGKFGNAEYVLTVSPTGLPQKLDISSQHIAVKFYNVSIKED